MFKKIFLFADEATGSFNIALYGNIFPQVLVSSLVEVLKKKIDLICFFFLLNPPCFQVSGNFETGNQKTHNNCT
jgi:hypothetical protein